MAASPCFVVSLVLALTSQHAVWAMTGATGDFAAVGGADAEDSKVYMSSRAGVDPSSHYFAAAAQHKTVTAASGSGVDTLRANLQAYSSLAAQAKSKGAQVIVFPEFGAFGDLMKCSSPTATLPFCEEYPQPDASSINPCAEPANWPASLVEASCVARNNSIMSSVNLCDARADGNYNAQLVFDDEGVLVANYHKAHPYREDCFVTPAKADIEHVTVETSFGVTFGIFTCKDILYDDPGVVLVREGVKHFLYSAAIPLIGSTAVRTFSWVHNVTMVYGNLQTGQGGVFTDGKRLTGSLSGDESVVIAAVLK